MLIYTFKMQKLYSAKFFLIFIKISFLHHASENHRRHIVCVQLIQFISACSIYKKNYLGLCFSIKLFWYSRMNRSKNFFVLTPRRIIKVPNIIIYRFCIIIFASSRFILAYLGFFSADFAFGKCLPHYENDPDQLYR